MKNVSCAVLAGCSLLLAGCGVSQNEPSNVSWTTANKFNYAPASRAVRPSRIVKTIGSVLNPEGILIGGQTQIGGEGSSITYDFGIEVAGILRVDVDSASDRNQVIGIAFTESSLDIGSASDQSSAWGVDGALYLTINGSGSYSIPQDKLRGGFRYLTVFMHSNGWVKLRGASILFTASPHMINLRGYPNYFHSNDDLLNKIWYAGAYTVQLNTIDPHQGRVWPTPTDGWENNAFISDDSSVLVDGAKRDRTVWPGDLGISQPTAFVSMGDTASTRNVLNLLYQEQDAQGGLPYCGPPVNCGTVSDTYHLWTLIASSDYFLETRDKAWLNSHWEQYKAALEFSLRKVDDSGLMNVSLPADWGRTIPLTGKNLSPNVLLYGALIRGADLALQEDDQNAVQRYLAIAASMKHAINTLLWDDHASQYRDSPGANLYPQDGNALAVWFQVVDTSAMAAQISQALRSNWNTYGSRTPERPNAIATFPGSVEVMSHFIANDDQAGLDLIRLEWGYMLNSPTGTNSTFWEGYLADGTFDYETSSMSKAHGWATGPTSALTYYVLGIRPEDKDDLDYDLVPHPGSLTQVEGRLTLSGGAVDVSWERHLETSSFQIQIEAPEDLSGRVGVPTFGKRVRISFDERLVWDGCNTVRSDVSGGIFGKVTSDPSHVYFDKVRGSHSFISRSACGS